MRRASFLLFVLVICATAWSQQTIQFPKIDRRPMPMSFGFMRKVPLPLVPKFDPKSTDPFQADVRSSSFTDVDLSNSLDDLLYQTFDAQTRWPAKLPAGFDPAQILKSGTNPGLGVRMLHARGVTGRGVGIGIVDQPLLVDHREYKNRLRLYEEINIQPRTPAQMHAPAVSSIAVGENVGVAPEADLYLIALMNGDTAADGSFAFNFNYPAQGIVRLIQVNQQLPADRKIRAISISVGWDRSQKGYDAITAACVGANAAGIVVFSCTMGMDGRYYYGLGRSMLADADDFAACEPPIFASLDKIRAVVNRSLLVPMDSRVLAGPCGVDDYAMYRIGGYSWCPPYMAGLYALAVQVDPNIDGDRFWAAAVKTSRKISSKGMDLQIIDPISLIGELENQRRNSKT